MDLQIIYDYLDNSAEPNFLLSWALLCVFLVIYYILSGNILKKYDLILMTTIVFAIVFNYFIYLHEFKEIDNKRYSEIAKSIKNKKNHYVNSQVQHFMEDGQMLNWEYDRISEIIKNNKYNEYNEYLKEKTVIKNAKLFLSKIKVEDK